MKVLSIKFSTSDRFKKEKTEINKQSFQGSCNKITLPDGEVIAKIIDNQKIFKVVDQTNEKVSTAIVLIPTDPEFKGLKILVKDGSIIESDGLKIIVGKKKLNKPPAFTGRIYGSIGDSNYPKEMRQAYDDFFEKGMYDSVIHEFQPNGFDLKNDYNFFIPTDGDGTRFKDYTNLQGGICKPAAKLPATLNGQPMRLIHVTMTNFTKTGQVEKGVEFINVDMARGSSYAFLEGLRTEKIPIDMPFIFGWGDNFSDINIKKLLKYHEKNLAGLTIFGVPVSYERIKSLGAIYLDPAKGLEIQDFKEKPKMYEEIMKSLIPGTKSRYLASTGPFVISKEVLKWLKNEYMKNPSKFQNQKGVYDFSECILAPLVQILKEGKEIVNEAGNKLPMLAYIKPRIETWSDLGKANDLINEMHRVALGKYAGLPMEVKTSIKNNVDINSGIIFMDKKSKEAFEKFRKIYNLKIKNSHIIISAL